MNFQKTYLFLLDNSEAISKLQEVNEKFRVRVQELESIVQQALEQTNKHLSEARVVVTHRDLLKGETPEV